MMNDLGLISPLAPLAKGARGFERVYFSFLIWPLDPDPVLR